jgi:hypothetical protein
MFRRHHTEDPLADRIDDLMAAVFIGNDRECMEGWSFGWMDTSGLVSRIVSFDGLVPGGFS